MDDKPKRHLFDNPRNTKRAIFALYAVSAAMAQPPATMKSQL